MHHSYEIGKVPRYIYQILIMYSNYFTFFLFKRLRKLGSPVEFNQIGLSTFCNVYSNLPKILQR